MAKTKAELAAEKKELENQLKELAKGNIGELAAKQRELEVAQYGNTLSTLQLAQSQAVEMEQAIGKVVAFRQGKVEFSVKAFTDDAKKPTATHNLLVDAELINNSQLSGFIEQFQNAYRSLVTQIEANKVSLFRQANRDLDHAYHYPPVPAAEEVTG